MQELQTSFSYTTENNLLNPFLIKAFDDHEDIWRN